MPEPPRLAPDLDSEPGAVAALAEGLSAEPAIALDTESNSFHVYRERVCLVQISTRAADYVLDPLATDVRPLGAVLARAPAVVLHGADYDVRCLKREFGFSLPGLFDTMAAARRLGSSSLGLSALVEQHFGVRLAKHSQRSDWGRRPLSGDQVSYAALDTHYLLPLFDRLSRELEDRGLAAAAGEEFARLAGVEPRPKVFDPEGWRHMKAGRDLDPRGRAILRALWISREERASALDRPPFKVMPEQAMVDVARRRPAGEAELLTIPGVTAVVLRRMGDVLAEALRAPPLAGPAPRRGRGDPR